MSSQSYQYGGDYVGSVLQTVELLQRWLVHGCVHVASPLVPEADLITQQQRYEAHYGLHTDYP